MIKQNENETEYTPEIPEAAKALDNAKHAIFVTEMIAHGNRSIAYARAYPGTKDSVLRSCASRLVKRPEIAAAIRQGIWDARRTICQQVTLKQEGRLTDIDEKRAILAQIIRGELVTEKEAMKKDKVETLKLKPDATQRMRAIMLDNKLEDIWDKLMKIPDNIYNTDV